MRKRTERRKLLIGIAGSAVILVAMILIALQWESDTVRAVNGALEETEHSTGPQQEMKASERVKLISPDLDALFDSLRGNWIIDRTRGAVIYIGRFAESGWGMHPELFPDEKPEWILSVTGGEMLTDCQVINWTPDCIAFCRNGYYSMLRYTEPGGIEYTYGRTPEMLDGIIRCDERVLAD